MLKLIAICMLVTISYGSLLGGYRDRPELLEDRDVQSLVGYAAEHVATTQDLILHHFKVTRVQTQTVAGINYKIDFTAERTTVSTGKLVTCQAVIYVRFDSTKKITAVQCDTA